MLAAGNDGGVYAVDLSDNLRNLRRNLRDNIDVDSGFIDELHSKSILNDEQLANIRSEPVIHAQNDRLIDYLLNDFRGNYDDVMTALRATSQEHIANYIQFNGGRPWSVILQLTQVCVDHCSQNISLCFRKITKKVW